jgi:DNA polymerase-3 subunit delta'
VQFKEIIGQKAIKKKLIETVEKGRISHAQLFLGSEGTGKLSLALAYAQYINCENPTGNDACGECKSCKKFNNLVHPDLHFVFPVVRTPKISKPVSLDFIDKWREFLSTKKFYSYNDWLEFLGTENLQGSIYAQESQEIIRIVNLKTFEARYKIIIIYMPEKMNITAANKLLKAIEEPPPNTLFLLVSEDESQILTTILSRTQLVKVPLLQQEDVEEALKMLYPDAPIELINDVAKISSGNLITAQKIMIEELSGGETGVSENFNRFTKFMRLAFSRNFIEINAFVEEISKIGREKQKQFIEYSLRILRENFILNKQMNEIAFLTKSEMKFSANFYKFINEKNIFHLYEEFNKAYADIIRNAAAKILFMDLILKTSKLLRIK